MKGKSIADSLAEIDFRELEDDEIDNEIENFFLSPEYVDVCIRTNSGKEQFFDVIGKTDTESAHSNFLQWLFENEDFCKGAISPLNRLVMLLLHFSDKNNCQILCKQGYDVEILKSAIRNNLVSEIRLNSYEKRREVTFGLGAKDPARKAKRSVDLLLNSTFLLNGQEKSLRIIIENKVTTYEHDSQCKAYECYYSNPKRLADYTFFVYLAPYRVRIGDLSSDAFISIDYQTIYDLILMPIISNSGYYSESSIKILKQYINSITNTSNLMVVKKEYRDKLRDFFTANRDLILTAMKYSEEEAVRSLANVQMAKNASNNVTFEYIYNGTVYNVNSLAELVYQVILKLANSGMYSPQQLIAKFSELGNIFASKCLISTSEPLDKNGIPNKRHLTSGKRKNITCGNVVLYVSNQLALKDKDGNPSNGQKFIDFVNGDNSLGIRINIK